MLNKDKDTITYTYNMSFIWSVWFKYTLSLPLQQIPTKVLFMSSEDKILLIFL